MMLSRMLFARPLARVATRGLRAAPPRRNVFRPYSSKDTPNMAEALQADPQVREMVEKTLQHPGALAAMQNLGQLFQNKGYGPEKMPSKMDLFRLMMDKEFREAAQKLTEELQKAGVNMDPNVLMKIMEQSK